MRAKLCYVVVLLVPIVNACSQLKPSAALVKVQTELPALLTQQYDFHNTGDSKKSVLLAVVSSLIVPGMGELYAGSFESGKYYFMGEGGLWLTYAGFRMHSAWIRSNAESYANAHAGAEFSTLDDQYAVHVGNFTSAEEYRQEKLRNREYDLWTASARYSWQ
jgi:hypothetical protein